MGGRSLTRPATALLGRLLATAEGDPPEKAARTAAANSDALRQHFAELTLAFAQPFTELLQPVRPAPPRPALSWPLGLQRRRSRPRAAGLERNIRGR